MPLITVTYPDGTTGTIESNDDVVVHGVDEDGAYLGLVAPGDCFKAVHSAPPLTAGTWRWHFTYGQWVREEALDELELRLHAEIDTSAGAARMRYITDVPGQQGVYLRKWEESGAFIAAGGVDPVPPYVQAEANATGMTPLQAAQTIVDTAALWDGVLSPQIEQLRIGGKRDVSEHVTAADRTAAIAARNQTVSALDAI